MTTIVDEKLMFITPAFVSGADQNVPEIRATTIRGALRWWFRAIGGRAEDETEVFGGVHGNVRSSAIVVRTELIDWKRGEAITFSPTSDKGYVYYFASKSGNDKGIHRTESGHYLAAGTTFRLIVSMRSAISAEQRELLDLSLQLFLAFGAIGLRATRGCGAFARAVCPSRESLREMVHKLPTKKFLVGLASDETPPESGIKCQEVLANFLRNLRSQTHSSGKSRSAFGFSDGRTRESSALRLRPVKTQEGYLPVAIYTDAACNQRSQWNVIASAIKEI